MRIRLEKQLLVLIIFTAALVLHGCTGNSSPQVKEEEETGIPVETTKVTQGPITATYAGSASLEAEEEALAVAKVSGIVKRIFVEEGDAVAAGQVLTKLDDEQYRLELNQAKSILEKLFKEYERNESLFKNKIVSQESYEKTKFEHRTQVAAYDLAELKLNYTEIKAPISGIVSQRLIKVGNMVKLDQPTFKITDFNPLLAVLHIPEKELSKLQIGFPAKLEADAILGSEFQGKILRISPIVDSGTGTFKVTVGVNDKTRMLKPGMFTRVKIVYDTHKNALLVPKDAILTEDSEKWAFLVKDDTVIKSEVKVGYNNTTHVEILSGLSLGDIIVTTGLGSLKDGSKIKVVE
ncbi:MAG: efflux RND transporter periplasmic adaptor subunit [Candidatus Aminicenantaceae bacterium]